MRTKILVLSLAIIIILLQPAFNLAKNVNAQEQPQTGVRITPAYIESLAVGEYFSINVSLENGINIYAFQVEINYDPAVLRPIAVLNESASEFPLIIRSEISIFSEELNITYNGPTYGQVYYVASRSGNVMGIDGDAVLFSVVFKVISFGSTSIELIQYGGDMHSAIGTYLMTPQLVNGWFTEVIPQLYSANYAQSASPTPPDSTTSNDTGQVQSAILLPYVLPLAALFLIVIGKKARNKSNL